MTTTPEQLQAWREEFHKAFPARALTEHDQAPTDNDYIFVGYLRRCQETEQAMKLMEKAANISAQHARKQAIEDCSNFAKDWAMEHVIEDDATMSVGDYVIKSMELLK